MIYEWDILPCDPFYKPRRGYCTVTVHCVPDPIFFLVLLSKSDRGRLSSELANKYINRFDWEKLPEARLAAIRIYNESIETHSRVGRINFLKYFLPHNTPACLQM